MPGAPKIYLETTVISYLTARPSRNLRVVAHQEITADWWTRRRTRFDLYVSRLVIEEASAGDVEAAAATAGHAEGHTAAGVHRGGITPGRTSRGGSGDPARSG